MNLLEIVEEIKKDIAGVIFLKDWLGDGGDIVTLERANERSAICRKSVDGLPCPQNVSPNWWEEKFTDPIAHTIRRELGLKKRMELNTDYEEDLHMCRVCGCALPLKVWVTTDQLKSHTPKPDRFPEFCWIRKEVTA